MNPSTAQFTDTMQARPPASVTLAAVRPPGGDSEPAIAPGPSKIEIRDVNFSYGKFQALHGISLPLRDRRVTAFIGPSGCGKSTLLRIMNRIYQLYPDQTATGEVLLDGENVLAPGLDLNLLRAKIGM